VSELAVLLDEDETDDSLRDAIIAWLVDVALSGQTEG
jgi:hypothetical protein